MGFRRMEFGFSEIVKRRKRFEGTKKGFRLLHREILAADTQCHVQCYDTVSDLLYDSKYKSSK